MNNNNKTMNGTRNILRNLMGSGAEGDICKMDQNKKIKKLLSIALATKIISNIYEANK